MEKFRNFSKTGALEAPKMTPRATTKRRLWLGGCTSERILGGCFIDCYLFFCIALDVSLDAQQYWSAGL